MEWCWLLRSWPRTLDAVLPGDVPLYYTEKHVKQTFLVDTYQHKFNHGFRKNQAISQSTNGHVKSWDISKMFHQSMSEDADLMAIENHFNLDLWDRICPRPLTPRKRKL